MSWLAISWLDPFRQMPTAWLEIIWPFLWQSSFLIVAIALVLALFRSLAPEWKHRVWLLVSAKLLILPCWFWTLTWQTPPAPVPNQVRSESAPAIPVATTQSEITRRTEDFEASMPMGSSPESLVSHDPVPKKEQEANESPALPTAFSESPIVPLKIAEEKPATLPERPAEDEIPASPPLMVQVDPPKSRHQKSVSPVSQVKTISWSNRWNAASMWLSSNRVFLFFALWLTGLVVGVGRWIMYWIRLRFLLAAAVPADVELQAESYRVAADFGLRQKPRLVVTPTPCSPFVCGGLRPTVVLPESLLSYFEPGELRRILLHELAHLKRRDLWWNWLPELCVVLYWFHPLVYWVRRETYSETELACDRLAMQTGDVPPGDYADTLVRIITHLSETQHDLPLVIAAATSLGASSSS